MWNLSLEETWTSVPISLFKMYELFRGMERLVSDDIISSCFHNEVRRCSKILAAKSRASKAELLNPGFSNKPRLKGNIRLTDFQ